VKNPKKNVKFRLLTEVFKTHFNIPAFNMEETIAVSGELTNVNNYRVVLDEILKMKDNVRRRDIPLNSHLLSPTQHVSIDDRITPPQ